MTNLGISQYNLNFLDKNLDKEFNEWISKNNIKFKFLTIIQNFCILFFIFINMNVKRDHNILFSSDINKGTIVTLSLIFFFMCLVLAHSIYEKFFMAINNLVIYLIFIIYLFEYNLN